MYNVTTCDLWCIFTLGKQNFDTPMDLRLDQVYVLEGGTVAMPAAVELDHQVEESNFDQQT